MAAPALPSAPQRKRRRQQPQVSGQVRRGEGQPLPPEIIRRILQAAVEGEGAVPFLCRASRVCRLWRDLAADPRLWLKVHLGAHLGAHLAGSARRRTPEQVLSPLRRLAETRFSHLQEFVLCDWSSRVGAVLQALSEFCPHLRHLELRRCQVEPAALGVFLAAPPPLQHLHLTCPRLRPVLPALAAGVCPQLRVLELDPSLGGPQPPLPLPLERLQAACPLLEVLCLSGSLAVSQPRSSPSPGPGFPHLRHLGLGDPGGGDGLLRRLLGETPGLRGLHLRGCPRVTPRGLLALPCTALEELLVAVPPDCPLSPLPGGGSWAAVTRRWHRTLLELDLSGRRDNDLGVALAAFGPRDPLRVLKLAGTPVTPQELRPLLRCPQLCHLDLSSCRRLPRGTKRPHRDRGEVLRLLGGLGGERPPELGTDLGTLGTLGTSPGEERPPELGTDLGTLGTSLGGERPPELGTDLGTSLGTLGTSLGGERQSELGTNPELGTDLGTLGTSLGGERPLELGTDLGTLGTDLGTSLGTLGTSPGGERQSELGTNPELGTNLGTLGTSPGEERPPELGTSLGTLGTNPELGTSLGGERPPELGTNLGTLGTSPGEERPPELGTNPVLGTSPELGTPLGTSLGGERPPELGTDLGTLGTSLGGERPPELGTDLGTLGTSLGGERPPELGTSKGTSPVLGTSPALGTPPGQGTPPEPPREERPPKRKPQKRNSRQKEPPNCEQPPPKRRAPR